MRKYQPPDEPGAGSSEIRSRLERLYRNADSVKHFPDEKILRDFKKLDDLVSGRWVNTSHGDVFIAETVFEIDYCHGNYKTGDLLFITDSWLGILCGEGKKNIDFRKVIFLDTETTGLSGGTGTLAFMVGTGYFSEDKFRVDQYFVDSFLREEGMLELLADFLKEFDFLITYNGKSFDIPLLENRYVLNRLPAPFAGLVHYDLLHPSRQLWARQLEDLKLSTIENEVLRYFRDDDAPGEEAPERYFAYLHSGNPQPLKQVFDHNRDDILSLAALSLVLWQESEPESVTKTDKAQLHFNRGKIYKRRGLISEAVTSFRKALKYEMSAFRTKETYIELGRIFKSNDNPEKSLEYFEKAICSPGPFILEPFEELAKYYEHKTGEYHKAIKIVQNALDSLPAHRIREKGALEYRLERLERKAGL